MSGPLSGLRVVEMAGIGPGPFACMLLSDMGAEVVRVDRTAGGNSMGANPADVMGRGRHSIAVNLKDPQGVDAVLALVETADILIEGFRPGVMERLGLGPDVCMARNAALVYGRMTGWGQDGPLANAAGHDINYIGITGALDAIGRSDSGPVPPLNLLGDFGGGSMYLCLGVLAALWESKKSGRGQVVDAAITDGVISLLSCIHGFQAMGMWDPATRQNNMLDGGAHYYDTYECADGNYICIGSIEPQFYAQLAEALKLDLGEPGFSQQFDKQAWEKYKPQVAAAFKSRTRDQWCALMEGTDICFAPVLDIQEATNHPHNVARKSFVDVAGVTQSAPAPRFSRTPGAVQRPPVASGADTRAVMLSCGLDDAAIDALLASGAMAQA